MSTSQPPTSPRPATDALRALRRHLTRLERKAEAIRGDLAEAERAAEFRRSGEALLAYLHLVPRRAERASLPDPADPPRTLEIAIDPRLTPQANAARYFKRAAKAERGLMEIPSRLEAANTEIARTRGLIARVEAAAAGSDASPTELIDEAVALLPPTYRRALTSATSTARRASTARASKLRGLPAKLQPRRLRTREGWLVLIGRTNEGNDHLTHHLARPEDYWFHVQGAPGSHVVLRRGKGKNEPSKQTIEEVAAWAAYFSQARTAGKVPVIYTRKKYVRRPRGAAPGLALCEREKSVMVRPAEPPRTALADAEGNEGAG